MAVSPPSFGSYLRHLRNTSSAGTRPRGGMGRTDLAARSGLSVGYVTKLEQGGADNPSSDVVDRLGDALKASDLERQHLHDLVAYHRVLDAGTAQPVDPIPEINELERQYVDRLAPHLAGYVDDAWNILYCNAEYRRIYRHIDAPDVGNVLKWFFVVRESRAIMLEWEIEARLTVAWLRALMVRSPGSPMFDRLLGELSRSPDFVRMWTLQEIFMGRHTPYMLIHDLDRDEDVRLVAQVYDWPNPTKAIQMYLGVRADAGTPPGIPSHSG
jgi:transcriptional regulator with XRE-family HTH domain